MSSWRPPFAYGRRPTRVVSIGDVAVGGRYPIRVQSMTTPATTDTGATVDQIVRLVEAGCEIVRVTVPTTRDADNLPRIRSELTARGIRVPLVADIHFTPAAAMRAVEHVDKVRVNPGNYADKKKFALREYTDAEYSDELARIERIFSPLVRRCKELGVAMRIGTNHGSLSDRIMNRYGDSPEGMVESALEFVRICQAYGYHEIVLSMKSSNPVIVLQAYRLLALRMEREAMDYPFHLGVTEAGDGEDGRIKSAMGIGALLEEGIGDTVRVSLTEDPVAEIPVAQALVAPYNDRIHHAAAPVADGGSVGASSVAPGEPIRPEPSGVHPHGRRTARQVMVGPHAMGRDCTVLVEVPLSSSLDDLDVLRREIDGQAGVRVPEETRAEVVSIEVGTLEQARALATLRQSLELVAPKVAVSARVLPRMALPVELLRAAHRIHLSVAAPWAPSQRVQVASLLEASAASGTAVLLEVGSESGELEAALDVALEAVDRAAAAGAEHVALALDPGIAGGPLHAYHAATVRLAAEGRDTPLVLLDRPVLRGVHPVLGPAATLGGLLCDGIGDAIQVDAGSAEASRRLAFNILQAARVRITRTDFISCPSCGRTLFDLETTTARIKARTAHLKGLKIAIMGCVVNGPGEMADADFGYVGWGEEKIALFVGKDLVERDIPVEEADERLVQLIKKSGRWVEAEVDSPQSTMDG